MAVGCFDLAAESLEQHSSLDRLEARGTLRLTLKEGGLDAKTLTVEQLGVICERLLPGELSTRGVENATEVCAAVMASVKDSPTTQEAAGVKDAYDIFRCLGDD